MKNLNSSKEEEGVVGCLAKQSSAPSTVRESVSIFTNRNRTTLGSSAQHD